jgi:hypothetical protein
MTTKPRKSWAMNKDYLISFKQKDDCHRVYDARTHTVNVMEKLPGDINKFKMLTHDDNKATDDDLKAYAKEFMAWNKELRFDKECSFKYSECFCDYTAVTRFFNARCDYKDHHPITPLEYKWFEKCSNFGLQYLKDENFVETGYGYDFKNQYALIFNSDVMIPTQPGQEVTLKKLPKIKDLQAGFYTVNITSDDDNVRKVFAYSKQNVYVMENLRFIMQHKKEFNIKIELVQCENNCYLYNSDDLISLKELTQRWYDDLRGLKKRYPKNRLVKHLFSSAWGHLNASNIKHFEEEDMKKYDVGVTMDHDYLVLEYHEYDIETKKPYWTVMDTKKPYKYNIRLKPWITGCARNLTASVVLQDIDSVIRIHTDGIVFNKEMEFDDENLVAEDKTTGEIHWVNNNCYWNKTVDYKTKTYNSYLEKQN